MTIEEYVKERKRDLDKFIDFWKAEQKDNGTEEYPDENLSGDWDEQFEFYLSTSSR